jgi:hypothetical protein
LVELYAAAVLLSQSFEKAMGYQRNAMLRSNQMLKLHPLPQLNLKNDM